MGDILSNPALIVDIVIIALAIIFVITGIIKGFTGIFVSILSKLLLGIVSIALAGMVVSLLETTFGAVTKLSEALSDYVTGIFGESTMNMTIGDFRNGDYSLLNAGILTMLLYLITNTFISDSISADLTLSAVIPKTIAYYIILVAAILVLYIIFRIILKLIGGGLKKITEKVTIIRVVDKILGAVLYGAYGYLIINLIVFVLGIIPLDIANTVLTYVQQSDIGAFIAENNVVSYIVPLLAGGWLTDILTSGQLPT